MTIIIDLSLNSYTHLLILLIISSILSGSDLAHLHTVYFCVRQYKARRHSCFGLPNTEFHTQSIVLVWVNSVVKSPGNSSLTPLWSTGKEHTGLRMLSLLLVSLPTVLQIVSDSQHSWTLYLFINYFL